MTRRPRRTRDLVVGGVLAAGLVIGVVLVVAGGGDDGRADDGVTDATTTSAGTAGPAAAPLPLGEDLSQSAVAELTGLAVPSGATGFLTARQDDDRQLDVTFVMPAADVDGFVEASGLPEPEADRRVVLHSSPLWRLNPDEGSSLAGATDRTDTVARAVELVTAPDGTVTARIVITSAS